MPSEVDDEGAAQHVGDDPVPDPYFYEGDTSYVEGVWSARDWERYDEAHATRNQAELDERRMLDSTGGVNLDQDPAQVRSQALEVLWKMQDLSLEAGVKAAAAEITVEYPAAAFLDLDVGDQGSAWCAAGVSDKNGRAVADFEEFEDEHWGVISELPGERGLRDCPWAVLSDYGLPRIDLRKAAQIDLHAIFAPETGA
ncbi:hypothetical protein GCM10027059_50720 [Myceligenerans halotolerans]